jgi:predicted NAD/FAD-binding protein
VAHCISPFPGVRPPRRRCVAVESVTIERTHRMDSECAGALPPARTTIRLGAHVLSVTRLRPGDGVGTGAVSEAASGVVVTWRNASDGKVYAARHDHVIFACHADAALSALGPDASSAETAALAGFAYAENTAYLHTDAALMPAARAAWASWNYIGQGLEDATGQSGNERVTQLAESCCVTYWLNRLQV